LEARGRILVLEEVGEEPYRIDRMLAQLALSGKLSQAAGFVVGEMIACESQAGRSEQEAGPDGDDLSDLKSLTLTEVFADHLSTRGRPVLGGLPCGHGRDKWTLPLGLMATVDAYKARLIVEEAACRETS